MKQCHIYLKRVSYWTSVTIVTLILCINWIHIVLFHSCIWYEHITGIGHPGNTQPERKLCSAHFLLKCEEVRHKFNPSVQIAVCVDIIVCIIKH